jgi:lysophospholipase L1-like esterase
MFRRPADGGIPRSARHRFALLLVGVALASWPFAAEAQTEQTVYLAFGDSITEGVGDDPLRTTKGYPPRLEALLVAANVNARVLNRGKEGMTSAEAVSLINSTLQGSNADTLILMIGTNDIPLVSNETILHDIEEVGRRAAARAVDTIHATLYPRRNDASRDADNAVTARVSGMIRELAWRTQRKLADPYEVFFNTPNHNQLHYPPGDKFHPNAAGYDILAQIFADVILNRDRVPPVIGTVRPLDFSDFVSANTNIRVDVYDFGAGIDATKTGLRINGVPVAATASGDGRKLVLSYQPPAPLKGVVLVELDGHDLATPPNAGVRRATRFVITGTQFQPTDIDRDGRVDGHDLIRLARAFGARVGEPRYAASADFDADGIVDGDDLALLANAFGKSAS